MSCPACLIDPLPPSFVIVPVLDLRHGRVVHARRGQRDAYAPVHSRLTPSSEPGRVLAALMRLAAFPVVYVADLDALMRAPPQPPHDPVRRDDCDRNDVAHRDAARHDAAHATTDHRDTLAALARRWPATQWWIDAGEGADEPWPLWTLPNVRPVIGTESGGAVQRLARAGRDAVLSLDSLHGRALGAGEPATTAWPDDVIVMTLERVGSGHGPDLHALAQRAGMLRAAAPRDTPPAAPRLWAAGGVRGVDDLHALRGHGAAGALVATALHDGTLDAQTLQRLNGPAEARRATRRSP